MNNIEKTIEKFYPSWSKLSESDKKIVNSIAMQIPISCEDVAKIFISYGGSNVDATIDYIKRQYGFVVDKNLGE